MENKKGFTMIEMLGVITMLVIVSLFTFPMIMSLISDSDSSKNKQFLKTLYAAAEIYIDINYDKYNNEDISYISAKALVEEGLVQSGLINPATQETVLNEDGIIEVSKAADRSYSFNYTFNQYITINYIEDLVKILNDTSDYQNKTIILNRDLDFNSDSSYSDINASYNGAAIKNALVNGNLIPKQTAFKGTLDGNGHEISNIYINRSSSNNVGLFSTLTGATIKNISLVGTISGKSNVGLLAGIANGNTTITNVKVSTKFTYNSSVASSYVGGLIGQGENLIMSKINAILDFSVNATSVGGIAGNLKNSTIDTITQSGYISGNANVGGIVGISSNTNISDSSSSGRILGSSQIGGIIGSSSSDTVTKTNSNASTSGTTDIGGIVGNGVKVAITSSFASGELAGTTNVGGLGGYLQGSSVVTKSSSTSPISGTKNVGGLVGQFSTSTLNNCYSLASINADSEVGGLVGNVSGSTVELSYYAGPMTASSNAGGIFGLGTSSTFRYSYFHNGLFTGGIFGSSTSNTTTGLSGLDNIAMRNVSSYVNWNFTDIWTMPSDNYPNLK